jgi:hypothetical protein
VLVNGKESSPAGPVLWVMILSGANLDAPAFAQLPPPAPGGHDDHAGHAH